MTKKKNKIKKEGDEDSLVDSEDEKVHIRLYFIGNIFHIIVFFLLFYQI